MKQFTIRKIGYTTGVYGCSGEYFAIDIWHGDKLSCVFLEGMYGVEQQVAGVLKDAGYNESYVTSVYGRLVRQDIPKKLFYSEHTMVERLKELGVV